MVVVDNWVSLYLLVSQYAVTQHVVTAVILSSFYVTTGPQVAITITSLRTLLYRAFSVLSSNKADRRRRMDLMHSATHERSL